MDGIRFLQATATSLSLLLVLHGSPSLCQTQSPPRLTQEPSKSIYYFDDRGHAATFTLPCQAEGSQPITYRWERDGQTVDPVGPVVTLSGGTLVVQSASEAYAGNYTCFASNAFGTAVSNPAQVQFSYLNTFQDIDRVYPVDEGSFLILPCEAPSGHPTPVISWTNANGQPLFTNGSFWDQRRNLVQDGEGNLVFLQISVTDGDSYVCTARTPAIPGFSTFSANKTVSVIIATGGSGISQRPPSILDGPQVANALREDDVRMYCLAVGNPLPTVTWTRPQDPSFSSQGPVLSLRNVQQEQDGVYTCSASSQHGQAEATKSLHIEAPPYWIVEPIDTTIYEGESASMICLAGGSPEPDIKWMENGQHIPDNALDAIQMMGLKVYQCVASNAHGQIIANAILNVTAAPLPAPSNVVATREDSCNRMTITWSLLASPNVTEYKILFWPEGKSESDASVKKVDKNTDHITIDGLKRDTTYYVRVKGYSSSEGDGLASDELPVAKSEQGQHSPRGAASSITQSVMIVHLALIVSFHLM